METHGLYKGQVNSENVVETLLIQEIKLHLKLVHIIGRHQSHPELDLYLVGIQANVFGRDIEDEATSVIFGAA